MTAVVLRGDARSLPLPDNSVDLVCTSPPYYGLRDYRDAGESLPGQIGAEATPGEYIGALLDCTREWIRVLKPSGSIFVVLGDKYASGGRSTYDRDDKGINGGAGDGQRGGTTRPRDGLPPKCLLGQPWRYAIACTDELGLILRAEICWSKVNALPESVRDRVRRSHETIFHFTKQTRYYAATDELREPHVRQWLAGRNGGRDGWDRGDHLNAGLADAVPHPLGALPGSVWEIASQPLVVPADLGIDHYAAYPFELVRRIVAGWSPAAVCCVCGHGRRPVADRQRVDIRPGYSETHNGQRDGIPQSGGTRWKTAGRTDVAITGYACACPDTSAPTRPAVVADPFAGTGTTALVADVLGRTGIAVDRSADYCRLARWRCTDPGERARALQVPKPPPVTDGQLELFGGVA